MPTIVIHDTILAGNLGEGWIDNNQAALALAEYQRERWAEDARAVLADLGYSNIVDVDIEVHVQRDAEGVGPSAYAEVLADADMPKGDLLDVAGYVLQRLTDSDRVWEDWLIRVQNDPELLDCE